MNRSMDRRVAALAVTLLTIAFAPTWRAFVSTWLSQMSHGFAAGALALWLLWRDREALRRDGSPWPFALLAVVPLSFGWLAAAVLNVQVGQQAALPLILFAWWAAVAGLDAARVALPATGVWLLAVPLWDVLTRPLQWLTIVANNLLLRVARIDANINGDLISIPSGTFHVAEGCAGIDYFQIGLLAGSAYALLFLQTWRRRITVILVAIGAVIVMNWLRVFSLIVIGHVTEMQSPLMLDHGTYGWILFGVAQVVSLAIWRRVEDGETRDPMGRDVAHAVSLDTPLAAGREWVGAMRSGTRSHRVLAIATGLAISGPVVHLAATSLRQSAQPNMTELATFTPPIGWQPGPTDAAAAFTPAYAGADHHARTVWTLGAQQVQVDRFMYSIQRQGKELIMYGNEIAHDSLRVGAGETRPLGPSGVRATITVVRTRSGTRLVWSWYRVAGDVTASARRAKLLELKAFVRGTPTAELVAVSTACELSSCRDAVSTLFGFLDGSPLLAPSP